MAYATNLVRRICEVLGHDLIEDVRTSFAEIGLLNAIRLHDTDAVFDWMAESISHQGISDQVAAGYIEQHGVVKAWQIRQRLSRSGKCSKLEAYWTFEDCGYRKTRRSCNQPKRISRCSLPRHDLRNGSLNQASYSLFLFMRDVAGGDSVGWLDQRDARKFVEREISSICFSTCQDYLPQTPELARIPLFSPQFELICKPGWYKNP